MNLLQRNQRGFTMVELIVGATVLAIIAVSLLELLTTSIGAVSMGKAHSMGLSLANEKMEYLRNLPYDSLATRNGTIYPPGAIFDDQTITRGNYKFRVHTVINFVDDPYDGNSAGTIPGKPTDLYAYDYKKAEVTVYLGATSNKMATLTTNIAAKAAETATNTGILRITVQDANGLPVPDAIVHITNTALTPAVDINTKTDSSGLLVIPKLPPDSGHNYQVTASLSGYNTDQTWPDPAGAQAPVNTNPNVLVQQITNVTLSIDRTSTLTAHVVDTSGAPIANQVITVTGSKKKYNTPVVYIYSAPQTTDSNGDFTISNLVWDSYNFSVTGKYLVSVAPLQPVPVNPNDTATPTLVLSTSSTWPTIATAAPRTDDVGSNPSVVTLTGTNFSTGTTMKLTRAGQPDITGTGVTRTGTTSVKANFDLRLVATGLWNIVVTTSVGQATATGAFNVTP